MVTIALLVFLPILWSLVCSSLTLASEDRLITQQCGAPIWEISDGRQNSKRKASHASLLQRTVVPPDLGTHSEDTPHVSQELSFNKPAAKSATSAKEGAVSHSAIRARSSTVHSALPQLAGTQRDKVVVRSAQEKPLQYAIASKLKNTASVEHVVPKNDLKDHSRDASSPTKLEGDESRKHLLPVSFETPPSKFGEGKTYTVMKPRLRKSENEAVDKYTLPRIGSGQLLDRDVQEEVPSRVPETAHAHPLQTVSAQYSQRNLGLFKHSARESKEEEEAPINEVGSETGARVDETKTENVEQESIEKEKARDEIFIERRNPQDLHALLKSRFQDDETSSDNDATIDDGSMRKKQQPIAEDSREDEENDAGENDERAQPTVKSEETTTRSQAIPKRYTQRLGEDEEAKKNDLENDARINDDSMRKPRLSDTDDSKEDEEHVAKDKREDKQSTESVEDTLDAVRSQAIPRRRSQRLGPEDEELEEDDGSGEQEHTSEANDSVYASPNARALPADDRDVDVEAEGSIQAMPGSSNDHFGGDKMEQQSAQDDIGDIVEQIKSTKKDDTDDIVEKIKSTKPRRNKGMPLGTEKDKNTKMEKARVDSFDDEVDDREEKIVERVPTKKEGHLKGDREDNAGDEDEEKLEIDFANEAADTLDEEGNAHNSLNENENVLGSIGIESESSQHSGDKTTVKYVVPKTGAEYSQNDDLPFVRPAKIKERELDMIGLGKLRHWRSMSTDPDDMALVAPLTDKGYQAVAALKSHVAMETYVRRVVTNMGCKVADDAGLQGLIPFYSGEIAAQSFAALEGEIFQVCTGRNSQNVWLSSLSSGSHRKASPRSKESVSLIAANSSHLHRALGKVTNSSGKGTLSLIDANRSLNLKTMKTIGSASDNSTIKEPFSLFIVETSSHGPNNRNLEGDDYDARANPQAIRRTLNLFQQSAEKRPPKVVQAQLDQFVDMAVDSDDVAIAAPLDEQGYQHVAQAQGNSAMEIFIRRVVNRMSCRVADEGGVEGVVPYYSGEASVQSFAALQAEIQKACEAKHSWLSSMHSPRRGSHRRMSALQIGLASRSHTESSETGTTAPISEEGLQSVAELSDDVEMQRYIRRVISMLHGWVVDEYGLHGIVPYYNGEKAQRSLGQLVMELEDVMQQSNGWIMKISSPALKDDIPAVPHFEDADVLQRLRKTEDPRFVECPENVEDTHALKSFASSVPLSQAGYEALVQMRNDCAMMHYTFRVIDSLECEVHEESGLKGIIPFYSGTKGIQDFVELQNEMNNACSMKGNWIVRKNVGSFDSHH